MENEKDKTMLWMSKYCLGFRNSRKKNDILQNLRMSERKFRSIISELKHEGLVASTSQFGYWAIPQSTRDRDEIINILHNWHEMKSRAFDMLKGAENNIKKWEEKLNGTQLEMPL